MVRQHMHAFWFDASNSKHVVNLIKKRESKMKIELHKITIRELVEGFIDDAVREYLKQ